MFVYFVCERKIGFVPRSEGVDIGGLKWNLYDYQPNHIHNL